MAAEVCDFQLSDGFEGEDAEGGVAGEVVLLVHHEVLVNSSGGEVLDGW